MSSFDLKNEIPKDQEWVYYPDFEKKLYRQDAVIPEVISITKGPKFHWFGYYDKFQTDPADRFVLSMEVDFDDRSPEPDDIIKIGMVDRQDNNKWIELGQTKAWCWQQGCMLQWRPGSDREILWNDRIKDKFVCHILDVNSGQKRTLENPIYHVHPNGHKALVMDYARLQNLRPGYGYSGIPDKNADILVPNDSYIAVLDLDSGNIENLFSVADITSIDYEDKQPDDDIHYFNCPSWSPDGSRFLLLNRWRSKTARFSDFRTRMFTANADGGDIRLVTDKPYISHFTWRDNDHISMWRENGYKLYKDNQSGNEEKILDATNGHISYLPGNNWIISDTYVDKNGDQNLFLFHIPTGKIVPLGRFKTLGYTAGEFRCDLHPRQTRDGKKLIIDSTHGGNGRQQYIISIENFLS